MFGTSTALSRLAHRELERNEEHARDSSSQLTHTRIFVVMTWRSCDGAFGPCLGAHCSMTRRIPKQWLTKRSFTPHHLSRPALVVPLRCKCQTSERDPLIKATWRSASCPYRRVIRARLAIDQLWPPPASGATGPQPRTRVPGVSCPCGDQVYYRQRSSCGWHIAKIYPTPPPPPHPPRSEAPGWRRVLKESHDENTICDLNSSEEG